MSVADTWLGRTGAGEEENVGGSPADEDARPPEEAEEDVNVVSPTEREGPEVEEVAPAPGPRARRAAKKAPSQAVIRGGPATRSRLAELADIQEASSDEDMIPIEEERPEEASSAPRAGASARSRGSICETQEEKWRTPSAAESGESSAWERLLHEDRKD
ncbi:hypothetical protein GLOTRDRAFT_133798 [Gloeophyllum trabeum ATCC 11539]|uniref:Uncharacterized protein n=1 Tax=Gloeophyllum trabeum (strain ATCC 11539 / FP-39264 / Madison 617) TaxID=670483 RepID=S7PSB2_GLOTA|nr:uncharacterized protein GLOTRDRAFT_133798 [Gloeophyllum trabeum ATCC 11539]EPQ50696.1 hypothetical protein GLOTRDRAFT_133798 [Gloeophyllum trabeum ATCC 11539]